MSRGPALYDAYDMLSGESFLSKNGTQVLLHGVVDWKPARPLSLPSLLKRLRLALNVFVGKYDALEWKGQ